MDLDSERAAALIVVPADFCKDLHQVVNICRHEPAFVPVFVMNSSMLGVHGLLGAELAFADAVQYFFWNA